MEVSTSSSSSIKDQETTTSEEINDSLFIQVLELGKPLGQFLSNDTANKVRVLSKDYISAANQCQILTYKHGILEKLKILAKLSNDPGKYGVYTFEVLRWDPKKGDLKEIEQTYQNYDKIVSTHTQQKYDELVSHLKTIEKIDEIKELCEKVLDLCPLLGSEEKGAILALCLEKLNEDADLYFKLRLIEAMPVGRISNIYIESLKPDPFQRCNLRDSYVTDLIMKFLFQRKFDEAERVFLLLDNPFNKNIESIKMARVFIKIGKFEKAVEYLNRVKEFDHSDRELLSEHIRQIVRIFPHASVRGEECHLSNHKTQIKKEMSQCLRKLIRVCTAENEFDLATKVIKGFSYFDASQEHYLRNIELSKVRAAEVIVGEGWKNEKDKYLLAVQQLVVGFRKQIAESTRSIDENELGTKLDVDRLEELGKEFSKLGNSGFFEKNGFVITPKELIPCFEEIIHSIISQQRSTESLFLMAAVFYLNKMSSNVWDMYPKMREQSDNILHPLDDPRKQLLYHLNISYPFISYKKEVEIGCLMIVGNLEEAVIQIKDFEETALKEYDSKLKKMDKKSRHNLLKSQHRYFDKKICSVEEIEPLNEMLDPLNTIVDLYTMLAVSLAREGKFYKALKVASDIKHPLKEKRRIVDNSHTFNLIFQLALKKGKDLSDIDLLLVNPDPFTSDAYYKGMSDFYLSHFEKTRKYRHLKTDYRYIKLAEEAITKITDPSIKARAYLNLLRTFFYSISKTSIDRIVPHLEVDDALFEFMLRAPFSKMENFEMSAYFLSKVVEQKKEVFNRDDVDLFFDECFEPIDFDSPNCIRYIDTVFELAKEYRGGRSSPFEEITEQYIEAGSKDKAQEALSFVSREKYKAELIKKIESM